MKFSDIVGYEKEAQKELEGLEGFIQFIKDFLEALLVKLEEATMWAKKAMARLVEVEGIEQFQEQLFRLEKVAWEIEDD